MQQRVKLKAPKFPPLNNVKIWRKASECCADVGCKAACAIKRRKQSCRWNSEASEWKGRMKAKVKGKVIIWRGKKKKNQIRAWTAWICFSLSRLYKCTKHSGRFFSRMLLVQIQVLKFQAFHLLHARTQNSAQSLHSQNSQQARAKLQNYSQVRYFKGEKKKNPDSRPSTGSADCWLGCEPPWCKRGIFSVAFSRREKHQGTAQRRGAPASSRCCNLGSVPKGREVETEWNYWNVCDSH